MIIYFDAEYFRNGMRYIVSVNRDTAVPAEGKEIVTYRH